MKIKNKIILIVFLVFAVGYFLGYQNGYFGNQIQELKNEIKKEENSVKDNSQNKKTASEKKYEVLRVIDGDTFEINFDGQKKSVRLLGVNTPEKKNPFRPQECFGEEASKKAKEILTGQKVKIEFDESQSKFDKFGRILAYVYLEDGEDFGKKMIQDGYAYEYTYHGREYKHQKEYKEAEKFARENKLGLWADSACDGKKFK